MSWDRIQTLFNLYIRLEDLSNTLKNSLETKVQKKKTARLNAPLPSSHYARFELIPVFLQTD